MMMTYLFPDNHPPPSPTHHPPPSQLLYPVRVIMKHYYIYPKPPGPRKSKHDHLRGFSDRLFRTCFTRMICRVCGGCGSPSLLSRHTLMSMTVHQLPPRIRLQSLTHIHSLTTSSSFSFFLSFLLSFFLSFFQHFTLEQYFPRVR
ncbi:uncharacterized protein BO72DRAFT_244917 [Aspergillus fijiensis CBS 313.89]|uniref:Uncharacterized protein n=1 Tax=Aspergillus fijiensis CBS 313.89 TaxID=1448319 RepID=A0A8G1RI90_9EURO|nr:uncharacterized protein BO72DRAFT_244917 [Aspergillus fijiensis CBS 313.89]RAK73304.1 hypothetical protein BO72DRAFT_244917 [Aspergillus fijiensis CBS 313.89]